MGKAVNGMYLDWWGGGWVEVGGWGVTGGGGQPRAGEKCHLWLYFKGL